MENKLGNFLKEKRGSSSLRDFANKLEISHTYLDSLEKGYDGRNKKPVRVTVDILSKIAKALNEPLEKLVFLSENKDYNLSNEDTPEIRAIARDVAKLNPEKKELFKNLLKQMSNEANEANEASQK